MQEKTYDSIVTNYKKDDYSFTYFEDAFFRKTHKRFKKEDYITFSLMNNDGFLTNAGVLLADQNIYRHNRIFCTRWNGLDKTSLEEASDDAEFTGNIVKLLDDGVAFIKKNAVINFENKQGTKDKKIEYDAIAIKEAIVNALLHRNYSELGSEVTIFIFDDRIEIASPGQFYSEMILNGIINKNIPIRRRNPILSNIFDEMKLIESSDKGLNNIINKTNKLFNDNKNHVDIITNELFVMIIIKNANYKKLNR